MAICRRLRSEPSIMLLLCTSILLRWIPEVISAATVTLDSIQIYQTHEETSHKPSVYCKCEGQDKKKLTDVKETGILYNNFTEPLTEFLNKECKQCGFYEEDSFNGDETFVEWEFCASNFSSAGGKYTLFKENEVNATFSCLDCATLVGSDAAPPANSFSRNERRGTNWILTLPMAVLVLAFSVLGG